MADHPRKPVVFVVAYWHDKRFRKKTGGLTRIFELGTNLQRLGHEVIVFLPRIGNPKQQTSARVIEIPFVDLPVARPFSFQINLMLAMLIASFRKVAFVYVRQMNSFFPHIIAKLRRVPIIYEIPNDPYIPAATHRGMKQAVISQIDRISLSLADRVVVLSRWAKTRMIERDRLPTGKVHVLESGSDVKLFRPIPRTRCCRRTKMDPELRYIGFVGSFLTHQGVKTLIEASLKVVEASDSVAFLLVGDGPMRDAWKRHAEKLGMKDRFIFTGHVPYAEVPYYIGTMDICVAPISLGSNQASPVKLFDYMACARPVVASDLPVVREIVGSSGCAELVPAGAVEALGQVLVELLADQSRRRAMADAGRKRVVENFSRMAVAEKLTAISKHVSRPQCPSLFFHP